MTQTRVNRKRSDEWRNEPKATAHLGKLTMCGTPVDLWERIDGKKECPHCRKYKGKERACNRCGNLFKPGCKVTMTCVLCHNSNKRAFDE